MRPRTEDRRGRGGGGLGGRMMTMKTNGGKQMCATQTLTLPLPQEKASFLPFVEVEAARKASLELSLDVKANKKDAT